MTERFHFDVDGEHPSGLVYPAAPATTPLGATLLLGHGAKAAHKDAFITSLASGLAARGIMVVTYDFPFVEHGRRTPDPDELLEACCRAAIVAARQRRPQNQLFIGGKSLGGRVASAVAAAGGDEIADVAGIVLIAYPLHPAGRPTPSRASHLRELPVPTLFVQGSRDELGTPEDIGALVGESLPEGSHIHAVEGGDHAFEVPAPTGRGRQEPFAEVEDAIARWMSAVAAPDGARARAPNERRVPWPPKQRRFARESSGTG